jgi:L-fucose isomerase
MGIAGSIVDPNFFQEYLGMRNESVDLTEIIRRMTEGIYDHVEFEKAMEWTRENCMTNEGEDIANRPEKAKTREQKDQDWEFIVKMMMIMKDLMHGNPRLEKLGYKEEAIGHNAIAGGFQGQRQWTDFYPNGDYPEALMNTSFDWNGLREPITLATENDAGNGVAMLFNHLLTGRAQIFSDVRTYWSPEAVKRGLPCMRSFIIIIIFTMNSQSWSFCSRVFAFSGRLAMSSPSFVMQFSRVHSIAFSNSTWS